MGTFGIADFFLLMFYLILIAAGVGVLVSVPAFLLACTIGVGAKLFGKKEVADKDLDSDLLEINKEFEKTLKEYNITNTLAQGKIFEEILAKRNIVYNENTKNFERRNT